MREHNGHIEKKPEIELVNREVNIKSEQVLNPRESNGFIKEHMPSIQFHNSFYKKLVSPYNKKMKSCQVQAQVVCKMYTCIKYYWRFNNKQNMINGLTVNRLTVLLQQNQVLKYSTNIDSLLLKRLLPSLISTYFTYSRLPYIT